MHEQLLTDNPTLETGSERYRAMKHLKVDELPNVSKGQIKRADDNDDKCDRLPVFEKGMKQQQRLKSEDSLDVKYIN